MEHSIHRENGYLGIFIGPMFSGKTSKLVELYKQYTFCDINTMTINYSEDTRYSTNMMSTHNKIMIPCIMSKTLTKVVDIIGKSKEDVLKTDTLFTKAKVILINEGQFFKDIVEWVERAVSDYHKCVYICGLDGDFKRETFGNWLNLIPFCDNVEKMRSFCNGCKKRPALFTHRTTSETKQKIIGAEDMYIPLCRKCYDSKNCIKSIL